MISRRYVLALPLVGRLVAKTCSASAQELPKAKRLVLVHGRDQQGQDPIALKARWLEALERGANRIGRQLPKNLEVVLPFYGDALDTLSRDSQVPLTTDVQARGGDASVDRDFLAFEAEVAESLRIGAGLSDTDIDSQYGQNPRQRGPENWEWVQAIIRTLDRYGGGLSQDAIEKFMRDVYLYTTRAGVRDEINRIVAPALTEEPTVVVGHSLGSVVAYSILRNDQRSLHVPLYVTVGCPLAIRAIRDQFRPLRFPQPPVREWFNAFDTRDIVALYPLDEANFPVSPRVTNDSKVRNHTDNRHGIDGYLDDPDVARKVLDALT